MLKRPISVSIAGGLMILVGAGSLLGMALLLSRSDMRDAMMRSGATFVGYAVSFLAIFITLTCGVCVFFRQRWARWLFLGWSAFSILYSLANGAFSARMLPSIVFVAVIGLLLTVGAGNYFRRDQPTDS